MYIDKASGGESAADFHISMLRGDSANATQVFEAVAIVGAHAHVGVEMNVYRRHLMNLHLRASPPLLIPRKVSRPPARSTHCGSIRVLTRTVLKGIAEAHAASR